jgi:uncharacterized membrane protein
MHDDPLATRYLANLRHALDRVPQDERSEVVREIESHIAEARARGASTADVLEHLGPADKLARAYRAELLLTSGRANWFARLFGLAGLLLTASIPSMIIIPLLGGLGLGFVAGGVAAIVASVLPFADISIQGLPEGPARLVAALIGAGLSALGMGALYGLWLYVRLLVTAFRRVMRA